MLDEVIVRDVARRRPQVALRDPQFGRGRAGPPVEVLDVLLRRPKPEQQVVPFDNLAVVRELVEGENPGQSRKVADAPEVETAPAFPALEIAFVYLRAGVRFPRLEVDKRGRLLRADPKMEALIVGELHRGVLSLLRRVRQ